jgi:hypothetical protein
MFIPFAVARQRFAKGVTVAKKVHLVTKEEQEALFPT